MIRSSHERNVRWTTYKLAPCILLCQQILESVQNDFRRAKFLRHSATAATLTGGSSLAIGSAMLAMPYEVTAGLMVITALGTAGLQASNNLK